MQYGFFHVFDKFEHFFQGRVHVIRRFRIFRSKTISHTVFSLILIRAKTARLLNYVYSVELYRSESSDQSFGPISE